VPETPDEVRRELAAILPAEAALGNPVDVLPTAVPEDYVRVVRAIARAGFADAVIAVCTHTDAVDALAASYEGMPALLVQLAGARRAPEGGPPVYRFPEEAARALFRTVEYGRWRSEPRGELPSFGDVRREEAAALLARCAGPEPAWLDPADTAELLSCWGLPLVEGRRASDADGVASCANVIGGPVAVKAIAPGLVRKSEVGGVALGVHGGVAAREAAEQITSALSEAGAPAPQGFLVQPMIEGGVEMLVGVTHDPLFGPLAACGPGGARAELERDVAVRLTPVTSIEAAAMVRELRTFPLLDGWKGAPPADVAALEDVVLRTAALADAHPEVVELDLDPVAVLPRGASILHARVRVAAAEPEALWPAIGASPPRS
jgi:acyl-CoA synthetase (NDP forming)